MPINSRQKGARNERAWASICRHEGYAKTTRGCQFAGGPDSPDIQTGDPELELIHFEVKSGKRIDVWGAIAQAERDKAEGKISVCPLHRDHYDWVVAMPATDFFRMLRGDHLGVEHGV
jgi:Holliday junction resolvase